MSSTVQINPAPVAEAAAYMAGLLAELPGFTSGTAVNTVTGETFHLTMSQVSR